MDNRKEKVGYWNLKEEEQYPTPWRTGFGRGFDPVAVSMLR
jgi:hypothetical protein